LFFNNERTVITPTKIGSNIAGNRLMNQLVDQIIRTINEANEQADIPNIPDQEQRIGEINALHISTRAGSKNCSQHIYR